MKIACLSLFLLVGLASSAFIAKESAFDRLVNEIIYEAQQRLVKEHKDVLQLPNVNEVVHEPIWKFHINGAVELSNGVFQNISTIYKIGLVEGSSEGEQITLQAELGLKDLQFHFDHYKVTLFGITSSGAITASVKSNSVIFKISMHYVDHDDCQVKLDHGEIGKLSDINVTFQPPTIFNKVKGKLFSFIINRFTSTIKSKLNVIFEESANDIIKKVDICGAMPF